MAAGLPPALDRPHFIGIGGAGMSGIARILAQRGASVAGSDAKDSATAASLRALGATVHIGHDAAHLAEDTSAVVVSSAIRADNPELVRARERGIPVVHRSDALAALMAGTRPLAIAGTHGKTTTTSMLAVSLTTLGLDPSYAIGGDLDAPGSNAHHGTGEIFVAEADESDRSFHTYAPEVAVVLNVELDHHANYASIEEIYESFETFVGKIVPGGTLVISADHEGARELTRRVRDRADLRVLTYGSAEDADVRVHKVTPRGLTSEVTVSLNGKLLTFTVSVPGSHYAHNAVAALVAGVSLGVPLHNLASALRSYTGVKRRLQLKGEAAGVQVVDSYAHHPTEMAADLEAMRGAVEGRILVVFQPHLFSRTQELGKEMGQALALADSSLVLDIYPAREDPIEGVTSELIIAAGRAAGADVSPLHAKDEVAEAVAGMAKPGDLVLTMGAGDVTDLGPAVLDRLAAGPHHPEQ
ncbi:MULTISPECIES: UDP-N-acetylmuramate--L-alanine ligase [unclassified Streptomyces]|uniref:UDP-N-acetylmuramate--L-alanine ligase n=1 Tax=Streptomyces evansiae TaxID=3075535 RepID=A0ABD5E0G8_9ACTN|nr:MULTISPECIES: UDP-N-acetylmuramate--L-alanine ligase [unclassified Streptomyces]ASY32241.1 UDP-N-acetylmuramate--L-alanine ligase [Streptomyces sp. CLI2509]EGJ74040.1 putative UDP-N-acetylmuramoyl-L-alanine ligase [Streptomyces sp. Tu6071]MDT0410091.1 UDP-N-acetylmuramate--L-alanine ligase [Streptomyces sp. DSM 41979]MDT0414579.1 UDP-N-acetylmuramate--L-alanine ligase [Streptomyces sp. DSM 41982]MYQ55697.1 UDP-N-acetylmuramate--L-alanine ligase [Streptomyces sp. SID4926]